MRKLLLLFAAIVACAEVTAPRRFVELEKDARFFRLWAEVEECSGLKRNPLEVQWYMMPGSTLGTHLPTGGVIVGEYHSQLPAIVIVETQMENDNVLRHEMLHAILRTIAHPSEYFVGRCGPLVTAWDGVG